jgi:phosphoserine phosphatase RsbU/P
LKVQTGDTPGWGFPLDRESIVVGRDASCELVLADTEVSKHHARISHGDDGFYIEDLQSTNGTRVGDRKLTEIRRLEQGDHVEIGSTLLIFAEGDPTILSVLDSSSQTDAQIVAVRAEEKLGAVMQIARDLVCVLDLEGVLAKVLETLFRIFPQAQRGFILFRGEGIDELIPRASRIKTPEDGAPIFSRTIFEHVTKEGQAILCEDVGADRRFSESPSVREARIRTMMCVPLWDHGRNPVGVLQIDTGEEDSPFEPEDLQLLVAVAGPVSVAVENARLHEIVVRQAKIAQEAQSARAVQFDLIPREKPDLPGYQFWHFYEPALFVGGDYFDYRPVPRFDGPPDRPAARWAIPVGDVTGHGMPAALLMVRLATEVGLLLQTEPDPARIVEWLNRNLCRSEMDGKFITFLLVLLDGERHELTVVNAGHMGPLIRRSEGGIEVFGEERSGTPLGIIEDCAYESVCTPIGRGDVVVLYTDGVNEAMDPEGHQFGFERLREALVHAPSGANAVGEVILGAVRRHAGDCDQSDDITLICLVRT